MSLMIDGPMINNFIENSGAFDEFAMEKFLALKEKKEEKLTESMALDREDGEEGRCQPAVEDLEAYKADMKAWMKAVAEGFGNTPVTVLGDEGSFYVKVHDLEVARVKKEEEEKKRQLVFAREVKVVNVPKNLKRKNSLGLRYLCACSGKQFVEN